MALLGKVHLGTVDWPQVQMDGLTDSNTLTLPYTGDLWKPAIFLGGVVLLWGLLDALLRRCAGKDARLLPGNWKLWALWGIWLTVFLAAWMVVDHRFNAALAPWVAQYGEDVLHNANFDEIWPILAQRRDDALMPLLWARRITAGVGAAVTAALLVVTLRCFRRKNPQDPLAYKQE